MGAIKTRWGWPVWAAAGLGALIAGGLTRGGEPAARAHHGTVAGPVGRLFLDDDGVARENALPVLLVHSFAGSTAHWKAQLAHLRNSGRAVAMDLRGHGRSQAPRNGAYGVPDLAADIAAVADALGLRRFILVGHSIGGAAAAAYAGQHKDRVAGLVLVGAPGKAPPAMAQQVLGSLEADYDKTMADYWDSLMKNARPAVRSRLEADRHRIARKPSMALIAATFAYDPLPDLNRYAGPALIIDTDHADGPAALYRQAPQIERMLVAGTSHWPQLDEPQTFNRLLDAFLSSLRR